VVGPSAKNRQQVVTAADEVCQAKTQRRCPSNKATSRREWSETQLPKRPRLDWATLQKRTFDEDVWVCPCGGTREVLAVVTTRASAEQLLRNLGLVPLQRAPPSQQTVPRRGQLELQLAG